MANFKLLFFSNKAKLLKILAILVIVSLLSIIVSLVYAIWILQIQISQYASVTSDDSFSVYQDESCIVPITSYNWGFFNSSEVQSKFKNIYIKNKNPYSIDLTWFLNDTVKWRVYNMKYYIPNYDSHEWEFLLRRMDIGYRWQPITEVVTLEAYAVLHLQMYLSCSVNVVEGDSIDFSIIIRGESYS